MKNEKRYDVVIKDMEGKIVSTVGRNLTGERADKMEMVALGRINRDSYFISIIPARSDVNYQKEK